MTSGPNCVLLPGRNYPTCYLYKELNIVLALIACGLIDVFTSTFSSVIVHGISIEEDASQNVSGHNFSKAGFGPETVILCDQCEQEYHVGCLKDHAMVDLKELPEGKWFCCTDCSNIHRALQKLVADGGEKLPDSLMNDVKKKKKHEERKKERKAQKVLSISI